MNYRLTILTTILLLPFLAFSQKDFENFIEAGANDASILYSNYASPLPRGINFAFTRGWTNTAKTHDFLGFDASINVSIAFIPETDLFYSASDVNAQLMASGSPNRLTSSGNLPTILGPQSPTSTISVVNSDNVVEEFETPVGFDLASQAINEAVPILIPQFGVGLIKNTDLRFRFIPNISIDDVEVNMFGLGLMHDIKQWIPGNQIIPVELSVLVGFTNFNLNVNDIKSGSGNVEFDVNSIVYQLNFSRRFGLFTAYGSAGYGSSNSSLDVIGEFDIATSNTPLVDPLSLEFEDSSANFTLGGRLKLAVFTIHLDYTLQEYNALNFGLGVDLR
ncbi:MAG: hypothetical protein NXI20_09805 [bacterium]|nr:hypothetical protein [bacterium]